MAHYLEHCRLVGECEFHNYSEIIFIKEKINKTYYFGVMLK